MLSLQVKEKNFMMWFSTFLCEIKAEKFSYLWNSKEIIQALC